MRYMPTGVETGPALHFTQKEADLLIELLEYELDELQGERRKSLVEMRDTLLEVLKYIRNEYPPTL